MRLPVLSLISFVALSSISLLSHAQQAQPIKSPIQKAQSPFRKLQVGEIELEGTIESLDVVKNTLTLKATSFTSPSGAAKTLPQPKQKVILVQESTLFLEGSGLKNQSLGDLAPKMPVHVIGKEVGGGRPFVARAVVWDAPQPVAAPDPDTPPKLSTSLSPPGRARDFSVRIINAGFASMRSLLPYPYIEKRPTYFFSYRLSGPEVHGTNDNGANLTLNDFVVLKRLYGPQGQILSQPGSGPLKSSSEGNLFGQGKTIFVNDLDPSWSNLAAEWEVLDPQAPPSAKGVVTSTLTFDHLPVPGAIGKSLPINRTLTTELGTKITLERVTGEQVSDRKVTNSYLHWEPPAGIPDLIPSLSIAKITSGETVWQSNSAGGGTQGRQVNQRLDTLGPDGATEMSITYKVSEKAPSLQERKWFSILQMKIPVSSLLDKAMPAAAPEAEPTVLAETVTPEVRVQAELRDKSWGKGWGGWLWIKSDGVAEGERWYVRQVDGQDEQGRKLNTWMFPLGNPNLFWRADGTRCAPNEYAQPIVSVGQVKPAKVNLQLKLEKARRLEHWSYFSKLPIPTLGQTVDFKMGQIEDDVLSVKRVTSFQNLNDLPGFASQREKPRLGAGVAVVVEISPLMPGADLELEAPVATDETGRDLAEYSYAVYDGDRTRSAQQNTRFRTILVPALPRDAKALEVRLKTVETQWGGETKMVELKNIAVQ